MNQGEMRNPRDHEIVGIFVSVLLTVGLAGSGALLAGGRGVPDALIFVGVLAILFGGFITLALVAVARKRAATRGWPRAAKGALWTGAAVAILNVAFWIVALLAARSRAESSFGLAQPDSHREKGQLRDSRRVPNCVRKC
jgi:hypothetical protein